MKKALSINTILRSPLFIIALMVCAANWQLLLGFNALQWDISNFWHPWRFFISECYNNGIVPLWDPYTQAGYPVHGDLQGPAYNPETIISSFLFPVNSYFFNYLFIGYLILGGWGFFKLTGYLIGLMRPDEESQKQTGALVAGIIYALAGYNTGHGHYLYITISVCLIPWIYYYFLKLLTNATAQDAFKMAVFVFMQVTAGNPSFIIVSGYFFAFITLIYFGKQWRVKQGKDILKTFQYFGLSIVLIVVLILPVLINAWHIFPLSSRAQGISLDWAAEERFALRNFFSFFTPLITLEREFQAGVSQPIFDYYLGLTTLFFAFIGIVKNRSFWMYVFATIALLAFLLSIGLRTPVFAWCHAHLPFFNVFRMPRLIFIYSQFFILIMAAAGINYSISNGIKTGYFVSFLFLGLVLAVGSALYFRFFYFENGTYVIDNSSLRSYLWTAPQYDKAKISVYIAGAALGISFVLQWFRKTNLILMVLLLEVGLNYNLCAVARNFSDTDAKVVNSYVNNATKGFAPPENIVSKKVRSLSYFFNGWWLNTSIFFKEPCYANDNNFELSRYMKMYYGNAKELDYFSSQPLVFLADSCVESIDTDKVNSSRTLALVNKSLFEKYSNLQVSANDTVVIKEFAPQHFVFEVTNSKAVAFALQQNLCPLWKIKLDGKDVMADTCYYSFPLIKLSGGKHELEFTYEVPHYNQAMAGSLICFVLLIVLIFWHRKARWMYLIPTLGVFVFCSFKFFSAKSNLNNDKLGEAQQNALNNDLCKKDCFFVLNTRDACKKLADKRFSVYNFTYPEDMAGFVKDLRATKNNYLYYIQYNSYHPAETDALIKSFFGKEISMQNTSFGKIAIYQRGETPVSKFEKEVDCKEGVVVKKGQEWGPGVAFKTDEVGAEPYDLIFVEAEVACDFPDFRGICISIDAEGKNKKFLAYNYTHYPNVKNQSLSIYYRLPVTTKRGDEIKAFVWNDDERPLILKRFRLRLISHKLFN